MAVITIWGDVTCPWTYVTSLRLHRARDRLDAATVAFDFRATPRDVGPNEARVRNEVAVLAQLESTAFSSYAGATWPAASPLAFEAQKWGYSMGQDVGERFDLALRRAIFLHSHDVSRRSELLAVAGAEGLDAANLGAALDDGRFRSQVTMDYEAAREAGISDSPQLDMPDGTTHVNPGITYQWVRGIPVIEADHPGIYDDLVRSAAIED